jgi:hypothetical protein
MERWLPVVGYEDSYEVSSHGRVRNTESMRNVGGIDKFGYVRVTLRKPRRDYRVHRLVLMAFLGNPPKGKELGLHRNGDKLNNHLENLYWGTQKENIQDSVAHGTHVNVAKTRCPSGHLYDEANTRLHRNVWRVCRNCHNKRERIRRAKIKEGVLCNQN